MTQILNPAAAAWYKQYREQQLWLREYFEIRDEKLNAGWKIENVKFTHDPHWRDNVVSCQRVGDWWREDVIKAGFAPYVAVVGYAENLIFWTWFDLVNPPRKEHYRAKSLPPKLVLHT